jgi:hypothetical protein
VYNWTSPPQSDAAPRTLYEDRYLPIYEYTISSTSPCLGTMEPATLLTITES